MSDRFDTIRHWCQKGDNDLKAASHEIEHDEAALDTVCFHAQQTAEKYLKAFLAYHNQEIPKTHTLIRLIKVCISIDPDFQNLIEQEIDELTDYAIEIRYADDYYIPTINEAREAIQKAEYVREFVRTRIMESNYSILL